MTPEERSRAGRAVEQRLYERSMTPGELALAANVDPKTVRGLVAGRTWPTRDSQVRIEVALGWDLGDLFRIALNGKVHPPSLDGFTDAELLAELQRRAATREARDSYIAALRATEDAERTGT